MKLSSPVRKNQPRRRRKIAAIAYLPFPDFLPPPEFKSLFPIGFVLGGEDASSFLVEAVVLAFFFCFDWEEESSLLDKSREPLLSGEDDSSPLDIFKLLSFSVENPESFFSVENPESFFSVENPEPFLSVENPESFFSVENPESFFSVENPESFFSVENPEPFLSVENPESFFSVENPESFFSVENPDSFFSVEKPESFLPLSFIPFFLSLIFKIYKHIF